jgi:hypothetical protein
MRQYLCRRAATAIEVDGDISKSVWQSAPWSEDFVDIEGDIRPLPKFRTRMKMLWDDEYLYVAAELEEPNVWGTLTERDSIVFYDNDFELFLDPDGDNQNYVELEINALGTVWDLLMTKPYRDGGMPMSGWQFKGMRTGVKVQGAINDPSQPSQSWTVEIALPWKALKEACRTACPPRPGDLWKANFSRVEWQVRVEDGRYVKLAGVAEDNWTWSPQGVVDLHRPEHWGNLQFCGRDSEGVEQDNSAVARELLHRVYYAQRDYRNAHGVWASHLNDLDFESELPIELYATPSYFEAVFCDVGCEWHIGADSYFWKGESYESKCVRGECEFRPDFGAPNIDFK